MSSTQSAFAALKFRDFSIVTFSQVFLTVGILAQEMIVGYSLYQMTKDPLTLGFIGLAEALPFIGLSLWGGYFADKFNKLWIMKICLFFVFPLPLILLALFHLSAAKQISIQTLSLGIYTVIFFFGIIRSFYSPAATSLKPFLIPRELYANGATWTSIAWQSGVILGPTLGGLMLAYFNLEISLCLVCGLLFTCFCFIYMLKKREFPQITHEKMWESIQEGFQFIWNTKILVWAISLGLASFLFCGVIALLPIFALDILKIGPEALGVLRTAPSIGALLTMLALTRAPLTKHAWRNMLLAVVGCGFFTLVFALSHHFWLSFFMLVMTGACDSVSVIIRQTILQLYPPENLRGRIASINGMFVSSSNEVGAFESGLAAKYIGAVSATFLGGCMTLIVVVFCYFKTHELFKINISKNSEH